MRLYAHTTLLCHSKEAGTPVGLCVAAGAELPSSELVADLDKAHAVATKKLAAAVRDSERAALQAELDSIEAQKAHAAECLKFLESPVGKESVAKWTKRGRLAPAKPAPKSPSDAAALLDEERGARKLAAQQRVDKYSERVAKAEKAGDKARIEAYGELLADAKAELAAIGG